MKKILFTLSVVLFSTMLNAQQVEYNTRAFAIQDLTPILETTEGIFALTIIPQNVKYYNCQGEVINSFKQYNISFSYKILGTDNVLCEHTISGETLCLLKIMAQKTLQCMSSDGDEGFVIDNGEIGSGAFRIQVSKFKSKWRMILHTGVYNQHFNGSAALSPKVTKEFVNTIAHINID